MTIRSTDAPSAIPAQTGTPKRPVSKEPSAVADTARSKADGHRDELSRPVALEIPEITDGKLQLSIDEDTGRVVGRIVDKESGEIIRQMPSDEILHLIAATEEDLGPIYSATA